MRDHHYKPWIAYKLCKWAQISSLCSLHRWMAQPQTQLANKGQIIADANSNPE